MHRDNQKPYHFIGYSPIILFCLNLSFKFSNINITHGDENAFAFFFAFINFLIYNTL
jgi:hypothetical protein